MILQALAQYYYERLKYDKELPQLGWNKQKVSYALDIDDQGQLLQIIPLRNTVLKGKKQVSVPQEKSVPQTVTRTAAPKANFLCDNSKYILGLDAKKTPEENRKYFECCKDFHQELLQDVDSPIAKAILAFFEHWENDPSHPCLISCPEILSDGGNIIFRYRGEYAQDNECLREVWQRYNSTSDSDQTIHCLISGKQGELSRLHPAFTGIPGAQSSGASLVSFNLDAFCSYGNKQGSNAPTCEEAAYAYGEAIKALLKDERCCSRLDDTIVLCWSQDANHNYSDMFLKSTGFSKVETPEPQKPEDSSIFDLSDFADGEQSKAYTQEDIQAFVKELSKGHHVNYKSSDLDPDKNFYILGISPNAARISVRFFLRDSFGKFMRNIADHHERLEIYSSGKYNRKNYSLSVKSIVFATVNPNSKDKKGTNILVGETLRSIISGSPYPASLLNGVELRINAEKDVSSTRAAIIKAYYLRNTHPNVPKEVLTVSLNEESQNSAYLLGRLFSALEQLQKAANPTINSTIKDRYFNSASSTPAVVFPQLITLAQSHLKKLDGGLKVHYEKTIAAIMNRLEEVLPSRLNMAQRGTFQLGYYHQTQHFFAPKAGKETSAD